MFERNEGVGEKTRGMRKAPKANVRTKGGKKTLRRKERAHVPDYAVVFLFLFRETDARERSRENNGDGGKKCTEKSGRSL